jgi:hypothetical protein
MKCPRSSSGKHDWVASIKSDFLGNKIQYRKCKKCNLMQKHVKNILTGRSEGWQTV